MSFIYSKDNHEIDSNWQEKYLDANQIDYSATNKLVIDYFLLGKMLLNILAAL